LSGWPSETDSEVKRKSFAILGYSGVDRQHALPGPGALANALAVVFNVALQVVH
jgi:hypothetical protein